MGIFAAIGAAVCAVAGAALSVARGIGAIGLAVEGLRVVVSAISGVCKALGLIREEIEPEELGDKAIQAEEAGIRPEKFDKYEEYVKAVEEFEVDPEKSKSISQEEKLLKASELSSGLILEKMPGVQLGSVIEMGSRFPQIFSAEKIAAIVGTLKNGETSFNNIVGALTNQEKDPAKYSDGLSGLVSIEKSLNPSLDDRQALKNVIKDAETVQKM